MLIIPGWCQAQQNQTLARRWGQVLALLWALLWALLLDLLSDLLSDLLAHQTSERQTTPYIPHRLSSLLDSVGS